MDAARLHCDAATVSNIRFENIRVEESRRLISLWIGKQIWSRDPDRGHIHDVTFADIRAISRTPPRLSCWGTTPPTASTASPSTM